MPDEREILEKLRRRVILPPGSGVVAGIGDDCAIYRVRGSSEDLLFTTDLLVEDVHFRLATHTPQALGHKALARGLSDIAAMGGEPRFSLLSLAIRSDTTPAWIDRFYRGLLPLAERSGAPLAGGDLGHAARLMCDIVVCGAVPRGTALRRSGARPGDAIYVSGLLGASALGLARGKGAAFARHLRPEPRLALGRFLRTRLGATAAMDLSDGLSLDLARLCQSSGVSAAIEEPPRFRGASLEQALHGGEDYELLFTVRPGTPVPPAYQDLPLTRIGTILKGSAGSVLLHGRPLAPLGYDHFRHL
ncbi:MAG TPA: thiamine-phosphate kinase [Bryobacteraceae bacterium]|nr:thiamine-phosphate kinase [Bryobacteraceae bacterium]